MCSLFVEIEQVGNVVEFFAEAKSRTEFCATSARDVGLRAVVSLYFMAPVFGEYILYHKLAGKYPTIGGINLAPTSHVGIATN